MVRSGTVVTAAALFLAGSVAGHGTDPIAVKIATDVPIWKTIDLGIYASRHALHRALKAPPYGIGGMASDVFDLPEFTVDQSRRKVSLVILSAADLGLEAGGASLEEIYKRAARLGLELCPVDVAAKLRLQYADQPVGEFLHIAMKPTVMANGDTVALSLGNAGAGLLLFGRKVRPDLIVPQNSKFVFVRRLAALAEANRFDRV